ncbi:MAG: hypothetical protein ABTA16_00405 [Niallia sp.]
MSYITVEYYRSDYIGEEVTDDLTLQKYINRASDLIDTLTKYRIAMVGLDKLPAFVQTQVMKATAAQAEYYALHESTNIGVYDDDASSASIGSFNYSKGNKTLTRKQEMINPKTTTYLEPTGLMYAGIDVHG